MRFSLLWSWCTLSSHCSPDAKSKKWSNWLVHLSYILDRCHRSFTTWSLQQIYIVNDVSLQSARERCWNVSAVCCDKGETQRIIFMISRKLTDVLPPKWKSCHESSKWQHCHLARSPLWWCLEFLSQQVSVVSLYPDCASQPDTPRTVCPSTGTICPIAWSTQHKALTSISNEKSPPSTFFCSLT